MADCPECGAPLAEGESCRAWFDQLLALEFEQPEAFAEHHLTVACYFLQHPAGYGEGTLEQWRSLLRAALVDGVAPAQLRRVMSERFEGPSRVRGDENSPPVWWPRRWSVIVRDVVALEERPATAAAHLDRVRRWAWSILGELNAASGAAELKPKGALAHPSPPGK
ncbi:MAG: DUF5946 family protein [Gemmatimonadaceae bacterium]